MTDDERLTQIITTLKTEDQDRLFEELRKVVDEFGFELSRRDPGPSYCNLDTGWCHTHNAWIDEHDWTLPPDKLAERCWANPKAGWSEEQIRASTAELRSL